MPFCTPHHTTILHIILRAGIYLCGIIFCAGLYFVRNYILCRNILCAALFYVWHYILRRIVFLPHYILYGNIFYAALFFIRNYILCRIIFCTLTIGCAAAKTLIYSPKVHKWHKWEKSLLSFFENNIVLGGVSSDAPFTLRSC